MLKTKRNFFFTVFAVPGENVEGKSRFSFHLGQDSTTFITSNKVAEEAIRFDLGYLLSLLKATGFDNIKHHPGGWTGNRAPLPGKIF